MAFDAYLVSLRERSLAASSIERERYHLRRLLQVVTHQGKQLRVLTPAFADKLYRESQRGAVDTHRNGLAAGKAFGAWCVAMGWLKANPFASVKGKGRRKHGKPQIGITDSGKLYDKIAEMPDDVGATITLAYQLFGARSMEVLTRQVRDLDDDGRVLRIPCSKTESGKRALSIPDELRVRLLALAKGKTPNGYLFEHAMLRRKRPADWAREQVERLCKLAGVPRVTPHGLRGTQSTIATAAGETPHLVSAALGHRSTSITQRSYLDADVLDAAKRQAALKVIRGGRA